MYRHTCMLEVLLRNMGPTPPDLPCNSRQSVLSGQGCPPMSCSRQRCVDKAQQRRKEGIREWMLGTISTENGKGHDKDADLSAPVKGGRYDVVVLVKEGRMQLAQPKLGQKADDVVHGQGRVVANEEITHVPDDNGSVDVRKDTPFGELVEGPKWHGCDEAEQVADGDVLVTTTDGEEILGHAHRHGHAVELLDVGAGPDVGSVDRQEDRALCLDNGQHHDVVEDGANDAADDL